MLLVFDSFRQARLAHLFNPCIVSLLVGDHEHSIRLKQCRHKQLVITVVNGNDLVEAVDRMCV